MSKHFLDELTEATGLPEMLVKQELQGLIAKAGQNTDEVTIDQLREIIAEYLRDVIFEMKVETSEDSIGA